MMRYVWLVMLLGFLVGCTTPPPPAPVPSRTAIAQEEVFKLRDARMELTKDPNNKEKRKAYEDAVRAIRRNSK